MAQSRVTGHDPVFIDIITIFDTKAILALGKSTDPKNPVGLAHKNMYMIVSNGHLVDFQATGDLVVKAQVNDQINWRAQSLTVNTADTVIFNDFVFDKEVIEKPKLTKTHPKVAIPDKDNPLKYTFETITDVYYRSTVTDVGESAYKVYFYIVYEDPQTHAQTASYYWWDPKVIVKDI